MFSFKFKHREDNTEHSSPKWDLQVNFVWCTLYSFSNYKFQNYLMVGNIHRNQHNAKINMFWNFSAPFISPFLHPNLAIRLISSWNRHFLNVTCIEQLNTLYLRNPILPSVRLRMQVSQQIILLHEATWINDKRWKTGRYIFY